MAKQEAKAVKQAVVVQEEVKQESSQVDAEKEALKKELEEAKAKLAEKDDESLKRVCKATGIDYQEVVEKEVQAKDKEEDLIEFDIGRHRVNINGKIYTGKVRCSRSTKEVIDQAVGDTRMRHMREKFGNDYEINSLTMHASGPKIVGRVNEHGEEV